MSNYTTASAAECAIAELCKAALAERGVIAPGVVVADVELAFRWEELGSEGGYRLRESTWTVALTGGAS